MNLKIERPNKKSNPIVFTKNSSTGAKAQQGSEINIQRSQPASKPAPKPQQQTISIIKPVRSTIVFQINRKNYKIEDAEKFREAVRAFLENLTGKKINDEKFIEMNANLRRFNFSKKRPNMRPTQRPPQRDEIEKQKHRITSEFNKLTYDNFTVIVDNLTIKENNFLNNGYLEMLADCLVNQATLQPLFSSLYSLCAQSIMQVMNNTEYDTYRMIFVQRIQTKTLESVNQSLEQCKKSASDSAIGSASFLGFLANRSFVPLKIVFDLIREIMKNPTPPAIEVIRQILIPSGEQIENAFKDQATPIFDNLITLSKNKEIPGFIRYPLIDLLDARSNGWNTKSLMHEIASAKNKNISSLTQVQVTKQTNKGHPTPSIKPGENQFAGLLNDDDDDEIWEEEEEEIEFDGTDMVRKYIVDQEISTNWRKSYVDLLFMAIALRPEKEMPKAMTLLSKLNENDDFPNEGNAAFDAIKKVASECLTEEVIDEHPYAIINCGTIFGRLVSFNCVDVDQFPEVFPIQKYDIKIVTAFLQEITKTKKLNSLRESDYWRQYEWCPEDCSQLDIAKHLVDFPDELFELFPLYDCIINLYDDIDILVNPDPNDDPINLEEEIRNFPPDVVEMPQFAIGAIEILVVTNQERFFKDVLPVLSNNQLTILKWVEKYYLGQTNQNVDQVADIIRTILDFGKYNLEAFKNSEGDEKHREIVQKLK